jgi:hypothetical protein
VTSAGREPGHGNGTVEAANPEHAKKLVRDFVGRSGGVAENIRLIPMR